MMTDSTDRSAAREQLSALIDGELGDGEFGDARVAQACLHWRSDADLRASWHAYHLIGDALRSSDLCSAPGRDAAFLDALRSRLAAEPVVLAPLPAAAVPAGARSATPDLHRAGRRAWRTPVAVAAGFVAVVGVVVATRFAAPGLDEASKLARSDVAPARLAPSSESAAPVPVATAPAPAAVDARALVASGQLIRDVRLDRYLSAHKQFAGSSALGVPSGFLRNATADAADR